MKLLFDQNLSPRLVGLLSDTYPGSSHVSTLGLDRASDASIFVRARDEGYAIVTKDVDFTELSQTKRSPPKLLRLRLGNCTTSEIEEVLYGISVKSSTPTYRGVGKRVVLLAPAPGGNQPDFVLRSRRQAVESLEKDVETNVLELW